MHTSRATRTPFVPSRSQQSFPGREAYRSKYMRGRASWGQIWLEGGSRHPDPVLARDWAKIPNGQDMPSPSPTMPAPEALSFSPLIQAGRRSKIDRRSHRQLLYREDSLWRNRDNSVDSSASCDSVDQSATGKSFSVHFKTHAFPSF